MSVQGVVLGKAVDSGGPGSLTQDWNIGGGASSDEDAVSLIGTVGGFMQFAGASGIQEYWIDPTFVDAIPSNATITNLRITVTVGGGGTVFFRFNNTTDVTNVIDFANNFVDYPTSNPFGGSGAWLRSAFTNGDNFGVIQNTGVPTISDFYIEVTFTIPDWTSPSSISVAGGDTVTFEALDGTFFNANYEVSWFDFPVQTTAFDSIPNGHTGTVTSPARSAGFANVTIYDTRDLNHGTTQPYSVPSFLFLVPVIEVGLEFLEDPSGTPTEYAITGGVTMGSSYMGYLSKDISGIYTLTANKRNDTVYVRAGSTLTQDVQIPNPFAELGFTECDDE